jgi:hypothetical protein
VQRVMRRTDDDAQQSSRATHRPRDGGLQLARHVFTGEQRRRRLWDQRFAARQQ